MKPIYRVIVTLDADTAAALRTLAGSSNTSATIRRLILEAVEPKKTTTTPVTAVPKDRRL